MKYTINTFIKNHKHVNYCEVIIYKNGVIEYANPSHIEKLIKIYGKTREELMKIIPVYESPIDWLVINTGCVAVWFNMYISPREMTDEQILSLKSLIDDKIVSSYINESPAKLVSDLYE